MKITRVAAVVYGQDLKLSGPAPKLAGEAFEPTRRSECDMLSCLKELP